MQYVRQLRGSRIRQQGAKTVPEHVHQIRFVENNGNASRDFVILLINLDRELWEDFSLFRLPTPILGGVLSVALTILVFTAEVPATASHIATPDPGSGKEVGRLLFTEYALPFEIASVVLFAGMVGAIVLAKKKRIE